MPYHIKKPATFGSGDLYWKGGNIWTKTYADRKQYSNKSDADAQAATTFTSNGFTYQPDRWKNSTVVTE